MTHAPSAASARRRQLLLGAGLAGFSGYAAQCGASLPPVLRMPAVQTPLAQHAAMLAVARVGRRIVAAGERGIVLLSDDGGRQWRQAQVPVQASLTTLYFGGAEGEGWAAGHLGVLLHTADAGETWTLQLDGERAAQQTLESATDDALRARGQRLVDDGPDKPFFDLAFGNGRGLLVGAYGLAFETLDGGRSWRSIAQRLPNPKGLHLYGVGFADGRVYLAGEQGLLLRSNDRGERYEALASPYKGSYFGLVAARSGTLVVYGLRGNAFRSTDGGANWSPIRTGTPVGLGAGIERADGSIVLLAQNGDLLVSHDDGAAFEHRPAPAPFPASGLAPADDRALIVAGLRGLARVETA